MIVWGKNGKNVWRSRKCNFVVRGSQNCIFYEVGSRKCIFGLGVSKIWISSPSPIINGIALLKNADIQFHHTSTAQQFWTLSWDELRISVNVSKPFSTYKKSENNSQT